jgi:hypothetical protein
MSTAFRGPAGERGTALPIVLALAAMLQVLACAQVDVGWVALRDAAARRDRLSADSSADAGLVLCADLLQQHRLPLHVWTGAGEPALWRATGAFDGPSPIAYSLAGIWPAPGPAPQCLAESRPLTPVDGHTREAVQLTVRAGGDDENTVSYRQRIWRLDNAQVLAQAWRSVAATPD